jgi:uncharacterized MAPEG superfamily protein
MTKRDKQTVQRMLESWAKVFVAAILTAYMSGVTSPLMLVNAGLIAVLPVIVNWLNPKYKGYGRLPKSKVRKSVR